MKLQFKQQEYQTQAVKAVVDCFEGQPNEVGNLYHVDPGVEQAQRRIEEYGFKNADITLSRQQVLDNIHEVQKCQNLPQSQHIDKFKTMKRGTLAFDSTYTNKALAMAPYHLDVEMETGTGKTYCYIKTIFEMNKRFGWTKFIVVVPSIAIREGVYKSLEITADHFHETYGKRAKFFIYNSKQLHNLETFSSDAGINVMVINVQAFNARGKDNRRIYEKLDTFQSRRPIDVIKKNRPILILDEPQKMEGHQTLDSLKEFEPLFVLRYSATHKTEHNKIHRLDALDAYNQKLVKKIVVCGISANDYSGTNSYLYLESIEVSKLAPVARVKMEVKQKTGIRRVIRKLKKGDNLYDLSSSLAQYKGFVVADINANMDTVRFTNGIEIRAGKVAGDIYETVLRRMQIREAIRSHLEKEKELFHKGIKVLTLFFIDEVAKYRLYTDAGEEGGEYAKMFEEEYQNALQAFNQNIEEEYKRYLDGIPVEQTHNGYFSIDKRSRRMIDSVNNTDRRRDESNDADAYALILKNKERLLSFEEPTRFIFSHSALREGWDNPNVFVICTLKHSDSAISRRQEVGRGLRISVNERGERQDDPATIHETNILTVVAAESYRDFVDALQKDISEALVSRPRVASAEYFTGKIMRTPEGDVEISRELADHIEYYLIQNGYVDPAKNIIQPYYDALKKGELALLPDELLPYGEQVLQLIDGVYSDAKLPQIEDGRKLKLNLLNDNFKKKEFKELWNKINRKAVYKVYFNSDELVQKCVQALNDNLRVTPFQYIKKRGEQTARMDHERLQAGVGFEVQESSTESGIPILPSVVRYDLIGNLAENVQLTRRTVARVLCSINEDILYKFKVNPENFISEATRLIQEQKATVIIEHLEYDVTNEKYDTDIFTDGQIKQDLSQAGEQLKKHIYDYAITDSTVERKFVQELDAGAEVVVYAKLPRGFSIPTPVGNYNPDWAIAFKEGSVKHIYFVAETKGSISSMQLRRIEDAKNDCARKFFDEISKKITPKDVKYAVVNSFDKLMNIVNDR